MKKGNVFGLRKALLVAVVQTAMVALAAVSFAGEGKKIATVTIPPAPELYATEPQPLTVSQCGQCHPGVFKNIKTDGGKHQFDCQKCHSTFHAYNPKKGGWEAIMPKCSSCHAEPHGKAVTDCAACHTNPHTPRKVAMDATLMKACATCHPGPNEQLTMFPSKHTKLGCNKCHTSHGYIPTCFNCHKPHFEGQKIEACATCHSVHKPLQITYGKDTPANSCGACHSKVYAKWSKTPSRHGKVNCATCHKEKHRYVPKCSECHPTVHWKDLMKQYPNCLSCHIDVHDPPAKGK